MESGKKPRKPAGLTGLSMAGLAPASSFVLTDSGTFAKGGFRINAGGIKDCPMCKGDISTLTLEQLEPLQALGSGACGTVRLARHKASGQLVALKASRRRAHRRRRARPTPHPRGAGDQHQERVQGRAERAGVAV